MIAGDIANPAFDYYSNGSLKEMNYDNGITTSYTIDDNGRSDTINVNRTDIETNSTDNLLSIDYDYDGVGNIVRRNNNHYQYDGVNRLKRAEIEGSFYTEKGNDIGYALKDYTGDKGIDLAVAEYEEINLDYASGSIGVDFAKVIDGISRIELNTIGQIDHRLTEKTIDILISDDNINYTMVDRDNWSFERDYKGDISIEINSPLTARYIKLHCKYDDWDVELDENNELVSVNNGQFINQLKDMVRVYRLTNEAEIIYSYDDVGNRTRKNVDGAITDYSYYPGTNRLMDNEEYGYVYDEAGNLIKKGNRYSIEGNTVTFTETEGEGVEYYEYEYNLQNRLSKVWENGEVIANFNYDADSMRIKAEEQLEETQESRTTYFIYGYAGKVLMEESSTSDETGTLETAYSSYIYAFSKTFAKVDGVINIATLSSAELSYFHYDNVGSSRLMTNGEGKVIMDQDYMPFGGDLPRIGQTEVVDEEAGGYKYTGQREVVSIGLYYYGARYYDPSIGRFVTEDSYPGEIATPQSQNLYVYVMNNPLRYVDPTGHYIIENEDDAGGSWTPPDEDEGTFIISPSDSGRPKSNEDILRDALTIPNQWNVDRGNPNEVYFDDKFISNLENEIAPFVGVNVAGGPVAAIIGSMFLDFSNNLAPKEGPPSKMRQMLVEQLIYEWNKIPGNKQIEVRAFDYNMQWVTREEAAWKNIDNNISDTLAGGLLSTVDLITLKGKHCYNLDYQGIREGTYL